MNLQDSYNRDDFIEFLNSFIPKYSQDIRRVDSKGLKVTKNVYYLGECPDLDLSIFELTHTSPRDARVALANDGFNIMKNSASYRALVVYNADKGDEWRLSLMTASHDVDEKGKPMQKWSNPRRLSFFLGPEAKIRTPNNFLKKKGPVRDFVDLLSRFDVEVVTKEFFNNYRKLFEDVKGYLEKDHAFKNFVSKNDIDLDTFAKKLLGQIVFCYFLQRKGWLGAPKGKPINEGDKNFMRSMFDRFSSQKKNYFNDCLEYLFYDSLNRPSDAAASFYRTHFQCQIPFLNGGLFEPLEGYEWRKEFIYIPDKIFSNSDKTGILDIFDIYNFTVYEDDPTDREVAVDPEMLGKVFENLLEENLRKGKGTYYTPREIVHYMCRESLINHLVSESKMNEVKVRDLIIKNEMTFNNEEKDVLDNSLKAIKVCDPACGSGAFLVGMLNEIVSVRRKLNPNVSEHQFKKEAIENCIYGVDIDFGAVEIAKLRLWLSLVVDYELEEIEPLPNLDYKIMCGNSLLEELVVGEESIILFDEKMVNKNKPKRRVSDKAMQMDLFNQDAEKYFTILRKLHIEYFHETNPNIKKILRTRIDKIELDFIKASINTKIEEVEIQIKNLNMQKPNERKKQAELFAKKLEYSRIPNDIIRSKVRPYFLWHFNFFEVFQENGGFDIVIANPPYIGESGNKDVFHPVIKGSLGQYHSRRMDYFYFFFHLAINLSNSNGAIAFISTAYFITATGGRKLRKDIKERTIVTRLINFNELRIFESAQGQHNMITMLKKSGDKGYLSETCITKRSGLATPEILGNILRGEDEQSKYYCINNEKLFEGDDDFLRLNVESQKEENSLESIFRKVCKDNKTLVEYCNLNQGAVTGANKITNQHIVRYPKKNYVKGEGIFILVKEELKKKGIKNESPIKPWFKNSDIKQYFARSKNKFYLIYLRDLKKKQIVSKEIKNHFLKHKELLIDRLSVCKKNKMQWNIVSKWIERGEYYLLFYPRKPEIFEGKKIVVPQRSLLNTFGYTEKPWYAASDVYFITEKEENQELDIRFILSLLNSKLYFFWLYHKGRRKGETLELFKASLAQVPIKFFSKEHQKHLVDIVDKILELTKDDDFLNDPLRLAKVCEYKKEIDQAIYKLYGLTKEEISIVENSTK